MRALLIGAVAFLNWGVLIAQDDLAGVKPIVSLSKIETLDKVFGESSSKNPLVLKSEAGAGKYFEAAQLKKLKGNVDFTKQVVVIFAWKGSSQDRITFDVAESYPEQVSFKYQAGRTRDLRPHVRVFAVRKNVKWSIKDAPARKPERR